MVCGWAGSLAGADGINVVAGTGSICYGEYAGRSARCGGWGVIFSDEGSAYWIAREGLALFSRMSDGRAPKGPLHELVRERLGARRDIELTAWISSELNLQRSGLAALARLVHQAAERNDPQAAQILANAAQELAELVAATHRNLAIPDSVRVPVSYSGGVFGIGEKVTAPFNQALKSMGDHFELRVPRFAPSIGAALYAAKCCGEPLTVSALERLERQAAARPVED
jgi:N-acetylglucosamine kinase-like BadF-type ATPase